MKWHELRSINMLIAMVVSLAMANLFMGYVRPGILEKWEPILEDEVSYQSEVIRTIHKKKKEQQQQVQKKESPIKEIVPEKDLDTIVWVDTSIVVDIDVPRDADRFVDTPTSPPPLLEPVFEQPEEIVIHSWAQQMPYFGKCQEMEGSTSEKYKCTQEEIIKFFSKRLKFPSIARENRIAGTVILQFVVDREGEIVEMTVARDPGAGLGKEVLRVGEMLDGFTPGKQGNLPVSVRMTIPIVFKFDE